MKLTKEDIEIGTIVRAFDDEESRWYKAKVIGVRKEGAVFKDVDPASSYQGMEWDASWSDVEDVEQYQLIKN